MMNHVVRRLTTLVAALTLTVVFAPTQSTQAADSGPCGYPCSDHKTVTVASDTISINAISPCSYGCSDHP